MSVSPTPSDSLKPILALARSTSAVLDEAGIDHCLAGSLAAWFRGGSEPSKDIDLIIAPTDLMDAAEALAADGYMVQLPPGRASAGWWFLRAWLGVDHPMPVEIIFAPSLPSELVLAGATAIDGIRLASPTHVLAMKLLGLRERHPAGGPDRIDMRPLLDLARSMSWSIRWRELEMLVRESPYARSFLSLYRDVASDSLECRALRRQASVVASMDAEIRILEERFPIDRAYDLLGQEYYDPVRHPTCAEFRVASKSLLRDRIADLDPHFSVEVGAGRSLLAEINADLDRSLEAVLITDVNPAMLEHSRPWTLKGARVDVAPASDLPVDDGSVDLIVASLGDPYNTPVFWREMRRVISADGRILFTAPAHSWALRLRDGQTAATMALGESSVSVPSYALAPEEQKLLVESVGLELVAHTDYRRHRFPEQVPRAGVGRPDDTGPRGPGRQLLRGQARAGDPVNGRARFGLQQYRADAERRQGSSGAPPAQAEACDRQSRIAARSAARWFRRARTRGRHLPRTALPAQARRRSGSSLARGRHAPVGEE